MPRKAPASRNNGAEEAATKPRAAKAAAEAKLGGPDDLARLALKACLIARDAAFNVRDLLTNSSRMAFLAIKDCEKELDQIERQIDERLPAAIVAMRVQSRTSKMAASDVRQLVEMSSVLREMLDLVHQGFSTLDLECARKVLQMDKEIDRVCHTLFQKHLAETVAQGDTTGFDVLLMAQALERAGDHTTNLAEDQHIEARGIALRHGFRQMLLE